MMIGPKSGGVRS